MAIWADFEASEPALAAIGHRQLVGDPDRPPILGTVQEGQPPSSTP